MATNSVVLTATLPINSTVDVTSPGFGTVDAAIVFCSVANTTSNPQDSFVTTIGFWDGVNSTQHSISFNSDHNVGTTNTGRRQSTSKILDISVFYSATCSPITNGLRFTTTTGSGVNRYITCIFINGATDVHLALQSLGTGTSAIDITAPAFKPDLLFLMGIGLDSGTASSANVATSLGVVHNSSTNTVRQGGVYVGSVDNVGTSSTDSYATLSYCGAQFINGSVSWQVSASDFDANGFSLTPTSSASNDAIHYLAIKLSDPDDAWVGFIDAATSTGNSAHTGVGFQPLSVGLIGSTATSLDTSAGGLVYTLGAGSSGVEQSITGFDQDAVATTNTGSEADTSNILLLINDDGTDDAVASISSFDSDGFTLNYSDAAASAKKILAFAIGDSTAGGGTVTGSVPDSLTITDTTTNTATIVALASDTLALSDTSSVVGTFVGTVNDSIVVTDEATGDLAGAITGAVPDAMSFTDTAAVTVNFVATASDSLGLTDTSSNTANRVAASDDSLALTDLIDLTQALNVAVNDLLNLTETLTGGEVGEKVYCAYYTFMSSAETAVIAELNADDLIREAGLTDELAAYGFMSDSDTVRIAAISAADTVVAATLLC